MGDNSFCDTLTTDIIEDCLWNKSSLWLDQIELRTQINQFEMFVSKFDVLKEHWKLYVQGKKRCYEWKTVLNENHV